MGGGCSCVNGCWTPPGQLVTPEPRRILDDKEFGRSQESWRKVRDQSQGLVMLKVVAIRSGKWLSS